MEFDNNVEYLRMAFWQIIMAAGPVLGAALAVGLVIGVIQAATSINEQTLSFVPKLVIVLGVFALLSGYVLSGLADYFAYIFEEIRYIQ
ncbi:FliQ Flagellar biosynthesis pathway, component FliQ [Paracoccaceae bacterium]